MYLDVKTLMVPLFRGYSSGGKMGRDEHHQT